MTLLLSQTLGLIVGIVWLARRIHYAKVLLKENTIQNALSEMFKGDFDLHFETKFRLRSLSSSFAIAVCAAFFAFTIRFDNLGGAHLIPSILFPLILIYALFVGRRYFKKLKPIFILGLCASVIGIAEAALSARSFIHISDI